MKYYENESRFNGVYSRGNLPNKIKDGAYVINLDEYSDIGTHWIARIQAYDSRTCRYFCIGFIDFMFKGKSLAEYTNLFSPNDFKKNDDTILNYFMNNTYL